MKLGSRKWLLRIKDSCTTRFWECDQRSSRHRRPIGIRPNPRTLQKESTFH